MTPKEALRHSALFSQLSDGELSQVADIISERQVEPGEMLIREGEEGWRVDVLRNAQQGQAAPRFEIRLPR